ncbi:Cytokinesis protein sepH (Serine/threonine-protein kinase sepH) [Durusdinium trenchii]|uniref:Cytokinesis protein sepH (Serine/threonine-protein kinase sepH) n=1 Tax=Durusdinium trenchii TaxID=1381693 RepID=A0ABP0STC0_9DINO
MPVRPRNHGAGHKISEKYTLGDKIGQGGFGTVYACRNSVTGETVAVKSIGLRNLNKESLRLIEEEVTLLKKLDHPNIVKYIDTVRTNDHLHIVLEYMENGSLARNLKLFGALSQSLCALYIRQVLNGLAYLHEQGVIHRDIKGANILTTKQGLVKLADFGVATHTSAQTNDVVGTPYWMAPEIIEMSGPTTACDIWSVGCTIVELLTLKPPYFDVPPMAALWRIVQDDHPPLPEGLSNALQEFLLLCFKKEPLLRSSAKDLLRHRWVHKARGIHEPKFVRADGMRFGVDDVGDDDAEDDRGSLGEVHGEPPATPSSPAPQDGSPDSSIDSRSVRRRGGAGQGQGSSRGRGSFGGDDLYEIRQPSSSGLDLGDGDQARSVSVSEKQRTLWRKSVMNTIKLSEEQRAAGLKKAQREMEEATANGGLSGTKGRRNSQAVVAEEDEDDEPLTFQTSRSTAEEDEEDDDEEENWDDWEQHDLETAAMARRRKKNRSSKGKFAGRENGGDDDDDDDDDDEDDDELDFSFEEVGDSERGKELQNQFRAMIGSRSGKSLKGNPNPRLSVGDFDPHDLDGAFGDDQHQQQQQQSLRKPASGASASGLESKLARFRESNDDEAGGGLEDDIDGDFEIGDETDQGGTKVIEALKRRMASATDQDGSGPEFDEYKDPFMDELFDEEDDEEGDFEEDAGQSLVAQQSLQVEKLIGLLRPDQDDETVLNACSRLTTLFREHPAQRKTLLTHHGVIPIMEMLEMSNTKVLHAVLKVVGQIIENDREFQELLSLAGLIPIVAKFCRPTVSRNIRLQAASLVKQFLKTSSVTLQMFVACGGLPILAGLLVPCQQTPEGGAGSEPSSSASSLRVGVPGQPDIALAFVAVDGIKRVFQLSSRGSGRGTIPKNDFCRLFAKEGVLRQLVGLLEHCRTPKGEAECAVLGIQSAAFIVEIAEVLLVFSHGDSVVKHHFADTAVLEGILRTLTLEAPFYRAGAASPSQQGSLDTTKTGKVVLSEDEMGPLVKTLLKCVKNLSMEPSVLETLEAAGAIPTLVPFLSYCSSMSKLANSQMEAVKPKKPLGVGSKPVSAKRNLAMIPGRPLSASQEQLVKEIQNLVMLAMFYLCRLSRSRQEQAAISGIIPHLMDAVATRSPVKTFALQILTDFAHTSDLTRDQLWRCEALDFYLDLLVSGDVFWQEKAFISLGAWLAHANPEVERAMLRPRSLQRLVSLFQSAQGNSFENYVKELLMMMTRSNKLSEAIGRSGLFMAELVARLSFPKAEVRINLLKMLKIIGEHHQDLEHLVLEHNLFAVVTKLAKQAEDAHRVLVAEIANQLLEEWRAVLLA